MRAGLCKDWGVTVGNQCHHVHTRHACGRAATGNVLLPDGGRIWYCDRHEWPVKKLIRNLLNNTAPKDEPVTSDVLRDSILRAIKGGDWVYGRQMFANIRAAGNRPTRQVVLAAVAELADLGLMEAEGLTSSRRYRITNAGLGWLAGA